MQRDTVQVVLPEASKSVYISWADWVVALRGYGARGGANDNAVLLPDPLMDAVADFVAEWVWYIREQARGSHVGAFSPRLASEPVALLAASAYLQGLGEPP